MAHWTYYHKMQPFIWQIVGDFGLRWYSLAYILGACFLYFFTRYILTRAQHTTTRDEIMDFVTYAALGTILGGRLGYCIFYQPSLLTSWDFDFPFWGVLKIHQGGMASHGGILGLFTAVILFARKSKINLFYLADACALAGGLGIFMGRIANFINGELYGRVVEGYTWFAVKFPAELTLWSFQLSEYKEELRSLHKVFPALNQVLQKHSYSFSLPSSEEWLFWLRESDNPVFQKKISSVAMLILRFSKDPNVAGLLEPLLFYRYPSQLYQAFLGGLLPFILACLCMLKWRRAGLLSAVWFMTYLVARIFTEKFRMPDSHIGLQLFDLTRGQWLSVYGLCILGIYAYFVFSRNKTDTVN